MAGIAGSQARSDRLVQSPAGAIAQVMLVDSMPLYRNGFAATVAKTPSLKWLGAPATVHAAADLCQRTHPDIVVVDSSLDPFGSFCQRLVHDLGVRTVMVVHEETPKAMQQAANALRVGAHGSVPRTAEPKILIDALRRIHYGARLPNGKLARPSMRKEARESASSTTLSNREHDILRLIANGLENTEIGMSLFVSPETVRTHVKNILRKLSARNRSHAIAIALTHGLVRNPTVLPLTRD